MPPPKRSPPTGVHWTFSPVLCIARDTRWGRVDETFGEDPYLIGEMASAIVKGYQGGAKAGEPLPRTRSWPAPSISPAIPKRRAAATPPKRTCPTASLESWFLPPFERVAKEGCGTFMLGYESIDGVPVTFNKWLLTDKLRGALELPGHADHRLGQRRPFRVGAEGQGRLRARRRRRGQGRQRPDHDHAEVLRRCHRGREDRSARRVADRRGRVRASSRSSSAWACSRIRVCRTRSASRRSSAPKPIKSSTCKSHANPWRC